jgi:peptide/nickel transport system ATP-binding protein
VELSPSKELYALPLHPYTCALVSAVPIPDPKVETKRKRMILRGDVPSPANPPSGCRFHTRCWLRRELGDPERCVTEQPILRDMAPGHGVACHFAEELAGRERREQLLTIAAGHSDARATAEDEVVAPTDLPAPPAEEDSFFPGDAGQH